MALVKCAECGGKVSTEAKACPACGAEPPRRTSLLTWAIGGVFAVAVGSTVMNTATQSSKPAAPEPTPAEKAAKAAADEAVNRQYQAARAAVAAVKRAARDPDSFKLVSVGVNSDATITCVEYRARNGFGGMNRDVIVFDGAKAGSNEAAQVNKKCTGLREFAHMVN